MRELWVEAPTTASKSIAHFTVKGATTSAARLGFAYYATFLKLVRSQFSTRSRRRLQGQSSLSVSNLKWVHVGIKSILRFNIFAHRTARGC
jgi:hypothetical protein